MGGRGASSSGGRGETVKVSDIAHRLIALPGGGTDVNRMNSVAAGLAAGKDLGPVKLTKLPNGKLFVEDGRHRLLTQFANGGSVRAVISRGLAGAEVGTVPLIPGK